MILGLTAAVFTLASHKSLPFGPPVTCEIVQYEDGSGVRYCEDQESGTFPAGTFQWDCETMGNQICGKP